MVSNNNSDVVICKICNRSFANGKARGAHMRSHLAKFPLPPKPKPPSPSSSSSSTDDKNPIFLSAKSDADSFLVNSSSTGRRSKRRRKTPEQQVSSSPVTDSFTEEDVAMCLLMLSKDNTNNNKWETKEDKKEDDQYYYTDHKSFESNQQGKYKCLACNKGFKSYQALGGHKASHKKMRIAHVKEEEESEGGDGGGLVDQRVFKCPFCDKVFESGQALGGHKKIHFSYLAVVAHDDDTIFTKSIDNNFLDLNLPAPEDDGEVTQV